MIYDPPSPINLRDSYADDLKRAMVKCAETGDAQLDIVAHMGGVIFRDLAKQVRAELIRDEPDIAEAVRDLTIRLVYRTEREWKRMTND